MKKNKILAANWKLNKTPQQTREFFKNFFEIDQKFTTAVAKGLQFVFFPSAFCLDQTQKSLSGITHVGFGPQNVYSQESGAFTGENSLTVALEMGATYVLVGHSERRQLFAESESLLAEKIKLSNKHKMKTIFCIGETLQERESNQTSTVLKKQLQSALQNLVTDKTQNFSPENLIIAYEPVWAIGTGKVATKDQVAEAHAFIHSVLQELGCAQSPILYGGSVKADNAKELSLISHVDGFLVGGASLDAKTFLDIAEAMI